jgi:hypothetical protein
VVLREFPASFNGSVCMPNRLSWRKAVLCEFPASFNGSVCMPNRLSRRKAVLCEFPASLIGTEQCRGFEASVFLREAHRPGLHTGLNGSVCMPNRLSRRKAVLCEFPPSLIGTEQCSVNSRLSH